MSVLKLELLTKEAFAPFGDVIEIGDNEWFPINNGTTKRYHNLGRIEVTGEGGLPIISMCSGDEFKFPIDVTMLERHPLGSQAFIPTNGAPFIVVVAQDNAEGNPDESTLRAFYVKGNQGVNYKINSWHHPLVTLEKQGDFIIVDRGGPGHNCDVVDLSQKYVIESAPANV